MSAPEGKDSSLPGSSLFTSLRSFWGVLLAIVYTRFDLLTAELEDEAIRAVRLIVIAFAGFISAAMTFFFLMFLLIASFWDTPYRLLILGIVVIINAIATTVFLLIARNAVLNRPKFLAQTLTELRRDVEGLRPPSLSKSTETSS